MAMGMPKLLEIQDLHVHFFTNDGIVRAVNGVDLTLYKGETLGLVGESGCGKSVTARAILNIVPKPGKIIQGQINYWRARATASGESEVVDIANLDPFGPEIREIRGNEIAMIFQEPMASFSPVHTIGFQLIELIMLHNEIERESARKRAIDMLRLAGIPDPKRVVDSYPFELSGGMRQRAMIAMALSCNPSLLIADEPTTALDVTIQAQILDLLRSLQEQLGMSVLLITHNLGVVASMAHRLAIMYLGQVMEHGPTEDVFREPKHPYTQGLLKSVPQLGKRRGERLWTIKGAVPNPYARIIGCPFHPRCPNPIEGLCSQQSPSMVRVGAEHSVKCFQYYTPHEMERVLSGEECGGEKEYASN
jgi:oligopeptide/dipeptide ABC transporter ATP-binding protein